jgi:hypothetical protein
LSGAKWNRGPQSALVEPCNRVNGSGVKRGEERVLKKRVGTIASLPMDMPRGSQSSLYSMIFHSREDHTKDLFDEPRSPYMSEVTQKWYYFTPEDGEVGPFDFMEDAVNGWIQYQLVLQKEEA